jgi:hypothetical protein
MCHVKQSIPHADKFYLNIDREGFLEDGALSPTLFVVLTEHLIREGNLLVVACREKAHLRLTYYIQPECQVDEVQTFWTMPASARAVYAPREKPNMQILSSA